MRYLCTLALSLVAVVAVAGDPPLMIALKPDKNPEAMREERLRLSAVLEPLVGTRVEVSIPVSGAVIRQGLASGSIDLAWLSATDMALASDERSADLLLAGEIDGRTWYESVWVVAATSAYQSIADLKGRPVAFASRTSTSGLAIPLLDLVQRGLLTATAPAPAGFFGQGNVVFGTGYVSAVQRVLDGQAEAAAVSDYVMLKDQHLTPAQKAALRILQRQGPVPTHCLAVRAGLPAAQRERVLAALRALDSATHAGLRDKVFTSRLVPVDAEAHLRPVRAAKALAERALGGK